MWRFYRFITRAYFRLLKPMRRLERYTNGLENTARFHKKFGTGDRCMITGCRCKSEDTKKTKQADKADIQKT